VSVVPDSYRVHEDDFRAVDLIDEAAEPQLGEPRMREIVRAALRPLAAPTSLGPTRVAAAASVLRRPDCPADLLLLVVTHPELDTVIPGQPLTHTVLRRPDCPDEVQVAYALTRASRQD